MDRESILRRRSSLQVSSVHSTLDREMGIEMGVEMGVEARRTAAMREALAQRLQAQQRELLMLVFLNTGQASFKLMKRRDIHRIVRESTNQTDSEQHHGQALPAGTLRYRDLQFIDPDFASADQSALVVRRGCIVFSAFGLHALVLHDKCLVETPDGADSELSILMERLRTATAHHPPHSPTVRAEEDDGDGGDGGGDDDADVFTQLHPYPVSPSDPISPNPATPPDQRHYSSLLLNDEGPPMNEPLSATQPLASQLDMESDTSAMPFEFRALEALFITMTSLMEVELRGLRRDVERFLAVQRGSSMSSSHLFDKMRTLKKELQIFLTKTQGVREALANVLAEDIDMAHLYLSLLHKLPRAWDHKPLPSEVEEIECLLECYLSKVEAVLGSTEMLIQDFEMGEHWLDVSLDRTQNKMWKTAIQIGTGTNIFSFCLIFVNAFGMSEAAKFPNNERSFWAVIGTVLAVMCIAPCIALLIYRRIGLL